MYHAVITNNVHNDEILTFGYISYCYKTDNFTDLQPLSDDLMQFVAKWICYQDIHLIESGGNGEHWRINVDHILRIIYN